jgi:multidrug efflux pump
VILGGPAPGYSSGQALSAIQQVADEVLGSDYSIGWTGSAFQEVASQGSGSSAFVFGLIMVFLILAAQYERWTLPLAVVIAVPFAVFGAILAVWLPNPPVYEKQLSTSRPAACCASKRRLSR